MANVEVVWSYYVSTPDDIYAGTVVHEFDSLKDAGSFILACDPDGYAEEVRVDGRVVWHQSTGEHGVFREWAGE